MPFSKVIFLADMESFYAGVEVARNPALRGKPVVVCGDPEQRRGIVLAASREAKAYGIKTGMAAWECRRLCAETVFVRPHMQHYLDTSLAITHICERYTDRVFPYSIDEQFLEVSGCQGLFGGTLEMAAHIARQVLKETGVRCRIGIGGNPLQAKMACDRFAKKKEGGIFELNRSNYARHTWPLPVRDLFGVGFRMERNLRRMAIRTIGHLAGFSREKLKQRWGINGELIWLNAHGIDYSTLRAEKAEDARSVGHGITLPRDYVEISELKTVILEIAEEVCRRARGLGKKGKVLSISCRGSDLHHPTGFSRQITLSAPSALTMQVYPAALRLFLKHWNRRPVRALGLCLAGLTAAGELQLSFFDDTRRCVSLSSTLDQVRARYGATSLFRAVSLTSGAQLFNRAGKIGGHEA